MEGGSGKYELAARGDAELVKKSANGDEIMAWRQLWR